MGPETLMSGRPIARLIFYLSASQTHSPANNMYSVRYNRVS
jgi:hypothetical protein